MTASSSARATGEPGDSYPRVAVPASRLHAGGIHARARGAPRAFGVSRDRWSRGALRRVAGVAAALAVVGCAPPPGDPFAAPDDSRGGEAPAAHQVRFEVSCDECRVAWSLGARSGGASASEALWSRRVPLRVDPDGSVIARVLAAPTRGRGPVSWVRIRLDGELLAEARSEEGGPAGEVSAQARVP